MRRPNVAFTLFALFGGCWLAVGERASSKKSQRRSVTVGPDGRIEAEADDPRVRRGSFAELGANQSRASASQAPEQEPQFVHKARSWAHAQQIWETHVMEQARTAGVAEEHISLMFPELHHPGRWFEGVETPGSMLETGHPEVPIRNAASEPHLPPDPSDDDPDLGRKASLPILKRWHTSPGGLHSGDGPAFYLAREATTEEQQQPDSSFDLDTMTTMDVVDSITGETKHVRVYNPDVRSSIDSSIKAGKVKCESFEDYIRVSKETSPEDARKAWAQNMAAFERCGNTMAEFEKPNILMDAVLPTISLSVDITISIPVMLAPEVKLHIVFKGGIGFDTSKGCWSVSFGGGIEGTIGIPIFGWDLSIKLSALYSLGINGVPWKDVKDDLPEGDPLFKMIFRPKDASPDRCSTKTPFALVKEFFMRRSLLQDLKNAGTDTGTQSLVDKAKEQKSSLKYWKALGEFVIYFEAFVRASKRRDYFRLNFNPCEGCGDTCGGKEVDFKCRYCKKVEEENGVRCETLIQETFHEPYRRTTNDYLALHFSKLDSRILFNKGSGSDENEMARTAQIQGQNSITALEPIRNDNPEEPLSVDRSKLLTEAAVRLYTPLNRMLKQIPAYADELVRTSLVDITGDALTDLETSHRNGVGLARHSDPTRVDDPAQDSVINIARLIGKAPADEKNVLFYKRVAMSTGNLFVRVVRDLVAIFGGNFANDKDWDGTCVSLQPRILMNSWDIMSGFGPGTADSPKTYNFAVKSEFYRTPDNDDAESRRLGQVSRGVPLWKENKPDWENHCCCEDMTPDSHKDKVVIDYQVVINLKCETSSTLKKLGHKIKGAFTKNSTDSHALRFILGRYLCCKATSDDCDRHTSHVYTLPEETCGAEYHWDKVKKLPIVPLTRKVAGDLYTEAKKTSYPHLWCGLAEQAVGRPVDFGGATYAATNEEAQGFRDTVSAMANQDTELMVRVGQACEEVEFHERRLTSADRIVWNSLLSRWGVFRAVSKPDAKKVRYIRHGWLKKSHGPYWPAVAGKLSLTAEDIAAMPEEERESLRCVWKTATTRSDCEEAVLPKSFVRIFPTLTAMINQYMQTIERILLNINICLGESLDARNLINFKMLPPWLDDFGTRAAQQNRGCDPDGPQGETGTLYVKEQALEALRTLRKFMYLLGAKDPDPDNQGSGDTALSSVEREMLSMLSPMEAASSSNTVEDYEKLLYAPAVNSMATDFNEVFGVEPTTRTLARHSLVKTYFHRAAPREVRKAYKFAEEHYTTGLAIDVFSLDVLLRGAFWRALLRNNGLQDKLLDIRRQASDLLELNGFADEVRSVHVPMQWSHAFQITLSAATTVDAFCAWKWKFKSWKLGVKTKEWCCSAGLSLANGNSARTEYCRTHATSAAKDMDIVKKSSSVGWNLASNGGSIFDSIGEHLFNKVAHGVAGAFVPLSVVMAPPGGYGMVMGKNSSGKNKVLQFLYSKGPLLTFLSGLPMQGLVTGVTGEWTKESFVTRLREMSVLSAPPVPEVVKGSYVVGLSIGHTSTEKLLTKNGKTWKAVESNMDVALAVSGKLTITPAPLTGWGFTANAELKAKFDLSPWVDKLWMYKVWQAHENRVKKCYECLGAGKGYCNYEPLVGIQTVINEPKANECIDIDGDPADEAEDCQDLWGMERKRIDKDGIEIDSAPQWFHFTNRPAPGTLMDCARMRMPIYDLGFSNTNRR